MARKKITSLLGDDPVYSKQFGDKPKQPDPTPKTEPVKAEKPAATQSPAPKLETETKPPATKPAAAPKATSSQKAPESKPAPKPKAPKKPATRAVHVRAAPKKDHGPGLDALEAAGLPASDVVRLAGKRAIDKFELKPKYVAPEEADRLPSNMSFRTMKTLDAQVLDKLRDQADPLRLRSDAAVIQGQLEPVFWSELTSLIKELRKQYS
ncbi:hypothetical protein [Pseudaestuariivita atlantica]|uniref:hypothetical protein n=1 Tax=Pseudaestuariivita atlantica TaxID=1317121 RepID=UPI00106CC785|nr:hypothetical protein [Pseudaestuariivita atlantica]